jgi:uncharacterized protein Smg (DUF494 family)
MIKKIALIVSDRLPTDLAMRGLSPEQVSKVIHWMSAQTEPVMDREKLETNLQSVGFSPNEVNGILVSIVKESVRPHIRFYLLLIVVTLLFVAVWFGRGRA